jgi:polyribonucleotide nucleotidyltransferase
VLDSLKPNIEANGWDAKEVSKEFGEFEYQTMRHSVLSTKIRIDGRDLTTVRPIMCQDRRAAAHPRFGAVHPRRNPGHRGHHAGHRRDGQIIDAVEGESKDHFLFHYNFPPFSVGEAGRMMGPKRREIGHGRLARAACRP